MAIFLMLAQMRGRSAAAGSAPSVGTAVGRSQVGS